MQSTSVNLLRRIRDQKSDTAWRRFVDLYAPLIFYWARQKGLSSDDASDVVQDVLTTLVLKLPEFEYDPSGHFRAWLKTITLNRVTDLFRRNRLISIQSDPEALTRITVPDGNDLFVESEYLRIVVFRASELLKSEFQEQTWQAFWLQVMEDWKPSVVSDQLQMPINAVYLAKSRILARLRLEMDGLLN